MWILYILTSSFNNDPFQHIQGWLFQAHEKRFDQKIWGKMAQEPLEMGDISRVGRNGRDGR